MQDSFIVSAVRIPIGKFLGALKGFKATELGAMVVKEAVARAGVEPEQVDEVIMGNVVSAGLGQNPARQAALGAGLPPAVGALTINKVCGSGLKAVMLARQAIAADDAGVIVAGGMESMSNGPYLASGAREGLRLGHGQLVDATVHDGLWDIHNDFHMGMTGELVSEKYEVGRRQMDEYAVGSHQKAAAAIEEGKFKDEILPVSIPQRKGKAVLLENDESVRPDSSLEALQKLKAGFQIRRNRHRRQRPGYERWGRGALGCFGGQGAPVGSQAHCTHRGTSHLRSRARMGHDDPGARDPEAHGKDGVGAG